MKLTEEINLLELAVDQVARTDDVLRKAEANNIKMVLWGLEWVEPERVNEVINEIGRRIQDLLENPESRGKHTI